MTDDRPDEQVKFGNNSGKVAGTIIVLLAVGVAGLALFDHDGRPAYEVASFATFVAALSYAAMLRPALSIVGGDLVMRNMLETVTVPLAAVESIVVRQVLVVRAGDRKITSSAIGRSRRQMGRDTRPAGASGSAFGSLIPQLGGSSPETPQSSYGLMVEEQLRARSATARDLAGIKNRSKEQEVLAERVQRRPALPEIAVLVTSLVAFVVLIAT